MTRDEARCRRAKLERDRNAIVDQIASVDAQSATISAAGGARSYTNRTVADLKAKLSIIDREIARLDAALGRRLSPGSVVTIVPRYV